MQDTSPCCLKGRVSKETCAKHSFMMDLCCLDRVPSQPKTSLWQVSASPIQDSICLISCKVDLNSTGSFCKKTEENNGSSVPRGLLARLFPLTQRSSGRSSTIRAAAARAKRASACITYFASEQRLAARGRERGNEQRDSRIKETPGMVYEGHSRSKTRKTGPLNSPPTKRQTDLPTNCMTAYRPTDQPTDGPTNCPSDQPTDWHRPTNANRLIPTVREPAQGIVCVCVSYPTHALDPSPAFQPQRCE